MIKSDVQLDAKGLACPMPIVKTKKAMNDVEEGQVLEVQATDKGSVADLAAWSKAKALCPNTCSVASSWLPKAYKGHYERGCTGRR